MAEQNTTTTNSTTNGKSAVNKAKKNKVKKPGRVGFWIKTVIFIIIAAIVAFAIYLATPYEAKDEAKSILYIEKSSVEMYGLENDKICFTPKNATVGFIFYPGERVQMEAYAQLAQGIAMQNNVLCVIMNMPLNYFPFNISRVEQLKEEYPQIKKWYIGGHSKGGQATAEYVSQNADKYAGLVLMGANPEVDLSNTKLKVLTFSATEDGICKAEDYDKFKSNLPKDNKHVLIKGGCHAYYGSYGSQWFDGSPKITAFEQQMRVVKEMKDYIN